MRGRTAEHHVQVINCPGRLCGRDVGFSSSAGNTHSLTIIILNANQIAVLKLFTAIDDTYVPHSLATLFG
jgi:hypothetical protein